MADRANDRFAEELAALRRVATLVARGVAAEDVFAAVTAEVGRVVGCDFTVMIRYDPDDMATVVAAWAPVGTSVPGPVGTRLRLGERNLYTLVAHTHRPVRLDRNGPNAGAALAPVLAAGVDSAVGAPIDVDGRLWGVMIAASRGAPLPEDTEARLAGFTELVATAIANSQARVEVRGFAEEHAALRRVAILVAGGAPPEQVFDAVTAEAGRLPGVELAGVSRFDPGGVMTNLAQSGGTESTGLIPVGGQIPLGGRNASTQVFETGRPVRMDDYSQASGAMADVARGNRLRSVVTAPITVEGRLWGNMAATARNAPLPADTEARLAGLTELVATAIASAQARAELRGFAAEQAALRRVATLVARGVAAEEVFAAVTAEIGRVLGAGHVDLLRYDPDAATVVGTWTRPGDLAALSMGSRLPLGGKNVTTQVCRRGRPVRLDDYGDASGAVGDVVRRRGIRSAVGVPISLEGRLWGVVVVASGRALVPPDTEARLAGFSELVATAIGNADARTALTASRARVVAAGDEMRRRIERDLHDGAQQRLVSLSLRVQGAVKAAVPPEANELTEQLNGVSAELRGVLEELRELARGIHPSALADGGLKPALKTLARRSAVPVHLDVRLDGRLPEPVELAAYFSAAELLTNAAKHAHASRVDIAVAAQERVLRIEVRDDGRGGAELGSGSGLVGLADRVEALGGRLVLRSPAGAGTTVAITLPLDAPDAPDPPHLLPEQGREAAGTQPADLPAQR